MAEIKIGDKVVLNPDAEYYNSWIMEYGLKANHIYTITYEGYGGYFYLAGEPTARSFSRLGFMKARVKATKIAILVHKNNTEKIEDGYLYLK